METAVIRRFPPPGTQAYRVLKELLEANGEWLNGRYFLNVMKLSQYHARIWALENRYGWKIDHSEGRDEYGFKSFRIAEG